MKRSIKIALVVILILTAIFCLAACDGLFSMRGGTDNGNTATNHTITLQLNGGTGVKPADFVSNNKLVEPASEPTRSGYVFDGYYLDDKFTTAVTFNVTVDKDITIYAKWKAAATFTYGTKNLVVAESDGLFAPPTDTARTGYTFDGWFADSAYTKAADFTAEAVAGTTFYGKYTAIQYTITYVLNGNAELSINAKITYTVEDEVVFENPVSIRDKYEFLRWVDEQNDAITRITRGNSGNKTITAVFLSDDYFIASIEGGTVNNEGLIASTGVSYAAGASYDINTKIVLRDAARSTFVVKQSGVAVTEPVALDVGDNAFTVDVTTEKGTVKTYTLTVTRYSEGTKQVTFHYDNGDTLNVPVESGNPVAEPTGANAASAHVREGYQFVAWYDNPGFTGSPYSFSTAIGDDKDLYAKCDPINYSVTYYAGIGNNAAPGNLTSYNIENGFAITNAVAPAGYTSSGWFDGTGVQYTAINIGNTGDKILYARYTVTTPNNALNETAYANGQSIAKANLLNFFNWAVAARLTSIECYITDDSFDIEVDLPAPNDISVPTSSLAFSNRTYNSGTKMVTTDITYVNPSQRASEDDQYDQLDYFMHSEYESERSNVFNNFKIESIYSTYPASITDQLIYIIESGYRPYPVTGTAATVYNEAKRILRLIVDDRMTDLQKAHAIYDWLILNVVYDNALLTLSGDPENNATIKTYNGFYLEGVFIDHRAVCDGISKAFVLMCGIEGIKAVQVTGHTTPGGSGHAWNKVFINGNWYVVDPTHGGTIISGHEVVNHAYFMITDDEREATAVPEDHTEASYDADTSFDVYSYMTFNYIGTDYDMVMNNFDDFKFLCKYIRMLIGENGNLTSQSIDVRIASDYVDTNGSWSTDLSYAFSAANSDLTLDLAYPGTNLSTCSMSGGGLGEVLMLFNFVIE